MRLSRRVFTALVFVCAAWALIVDRSDRVSAQEPAPPAMRWDGLIEHITAPLPWGDQQPDGPSQLPRHSVSADGRYVIFTSDATNLGGSPGPAVFVRDRDTGTTQYLIGWGKHPALSADGNHVAFEACDPWLRPDGLAVCDVWTLDLRSYMIARMSETSDGTPGDGDSTQPVLSADGRFVAFRTNATNLLSPGATPGQIVVRDRDADGNGIFDEPGTTAIDIVSAETGSNSPGNDVSESAELSDDGRYVAFRSRAKNLVATTATADWNVFLRDRVAHETRQVNVRPEGQSSPFSVDSRDISITSDGRYVAFASSDPMLAAGVPDDTDTALDVFVYDRDTQWTNRIDLTSDGLGGTGDVQSPMFSADGRYVAVVAMSRNDSNPPAPFSNLVHVYDRATAASTLVSVRPDGVTPDDRSDAAAISADGSTVLFVSAATNLAPSVTARLDAIYAAVHFDVQPNEVTVPGRGGSATFTVTAQAHTRWSTIWDWNAYWFMPTGVPQAVGNGSFSGAAQQANFDPTPRSINITFNAAKTVVFTQSAGLSLTSVSPSSGPATGGTVVTLRGTGFEPDDRVDVGGNAANVEFIDSTTLVATMPPGQVGSTWVGVISSDWRGGLMSDAFRYLDTTPPDVIYPAVSGTLGGDGWYTDDVTVSWLTWDQDGPIISRTGCDTTTVSTDTPGMTITCSATSEGGTASASTTFKRDTTRPAINITSPSPSRAIYERGEIVPAAYECSDALSGVATCGGDVQPGEPIDTSSFGYHQFLAWSGDRAGNLGGAYADYAVSYGFCAPPNPGLKAWWRMEGDTIEQMSGSPALRVNIAQDAFDAAITGRGYVFPPRSTGRLDHYHYSALDFSGAMTFAAWVKPANAGWGMLVRHPFQYLVQRFGDGSIGFQFAQQDGGVAQKTTTAKAPQNVWTHIAVTYDNGLVKTYVNGRVVDIYSHPGLLRVPAWQTPLSIGGQDDPGNPKPFVGGLDEVQLFDRALSDDDVESMFLSGNHGLCLAQPTTLDVPSPIHTTYGAATYHVIAMLRDQSGMPLQNQPITLYQQAYDEAGDPMPSVTLTTDASGSVFWDAPFDLAAGTYPGGLLAVFNGNAVHARSETRADVIVDKAAVAITWPAPASITYGTALSYGGQLNATASVPGIFSYSPYSGAVLDAGSHTLNATFYPTDATNYADANASVPLVVNKATPNVTIAGGAFLYDGQPHAASASATDYRGLPLTPVTIAYNGSQDVPVAAGSYTALATYGGDLNHNARSVSATITIQKATPSIVVSSPTTFTYDAQPHGVTAAVYGVGGTSIGSAHVVYAGLTGEPVNAGTYTATVTFDGDTNYAAASATANITINKAVPVVSVTGGTFTFDGQLHPAMATVTGVAGESLTPVTFQYWRDGFGYVDPINAGTYQATAFFAGTVNYMARSGSAVLTIGKAAPTVTWPAPSSIVYGTALGAAQLNASSNVAGSFAYSPNFNTVLPAGAGRALSATFLPSDPQNYASASATTTIDVLRAPLTVRTVDSSKPFGAALPPFTATASGLVNGDSMTSLGGTLTFSTAATAASPVGTYAVTPAGLTSSNYAIAFAAGTLTVTPATTAVVVSSSANPSGANQGVTFSASVSVVAGAGNPTGTIEFRDGSTRLGTIALASGAASLATNGLSIGSHTISAIYSGDPSFAGSTQSMTHVVNTSSMSSTVAVTSSADPSTSGSTVTLTATLTAPAGATGSVAFYDGAALIGTASLTGTTARLSTSAFAVGAHAITARYLGDTSVPPSISPVFVQDVAPSGTHPKTSTMTLVASPSPAALDGQVTFTATVTGSNKMPTGAVLFMVNGQVIGSAVPVTATGSVTARAVLNTSTLAHGTHTVTATYLGDTTYRGVASTISLTVN